MPSASRTVVRPPASANPAQLPPPVEPAPPAPPRTKSPRAILCSARARLTDPAHWLHADPHHQAVDATGRGCLAWEPAAARWDVYGALCAAWGTIPATDEALRLLARAAGLAVVDFLAIVDWNDAPERTHAEILAALDKAIAAAPEGTC
jgi:hypothetical protein